ncbi:transcriptional regulator [Labedaea rhizosphaerae]|uniref:transcriptional regulator n=1 Tax=Labedaea rhizosphaerae TaxID=598644 RepID=UPI001FB800BB|nr:transcriptional regulator [Labedaea rhizosphaerae]
MTVDWNGQALHVDVIETPLNGLYFNPATHRIRAQRTHDPKRDAELEADPYSAASQDYLKHLLQASPADPNRRDPEFDDLLESLKEFGQNDPGLITHQGVLVNGNTRAAALRESGAQSMRVGVLPESFTWADVNSVELSLQLRKDHRREYSYINRLLAMEEQAALGRTPELIAKEFRIRTETYRQERWILGVIYELIERSRDPEHGTALRLIDFEHHQEKLKELYRAYDKMKAIDPDRADVLKELRLAAITLEFAKTDVRLIEDGTEFRKRYLDSELPAGFAAADPADASVSIPGLGISVAGTSDAVAAARGLTDQILRAKAGRGATGVLSDDQSRAASQSYEQVKRAFDTALETAGRNARLKKRKQMAPGRLADASASIDLCVADLVQARSSRSLDEEAFDDAVLKLRDSLRKLAKQAGRGLQNPGDGVTWLLDATAPGGIR